MFSDLPLDLIDILQSFTVSGRERDMKCIGIQDSVQRYQVLRARVLEDHGDIAD